MKVLIVTSISRSGVGGPALYADNLPKALANEGIESTVLRLSSAPRPIRDIIYIFNIALKGRGHKIFYSLSGSPAINLPLLVFAKIFRKKLIVRPGGDFLWERAMESGTTEKTLKEYYEGGEHRKSFLSFLLFSFVIRRSDKIIFPTEYLKKLYIDYYGVNEDKSAVVRYPYPEMWTSEVHTFDEVHTFESLRQNSGQATQGKQFIFAGRLIKFKNLGRLIRAFSQIKDRKGVGLKIIGDGPEKEKLEDLAKSLEADEYIKFKSSVSHDDLFKEIAESYAVVVPSIFEPGSFFMLESLKLGTPVIFTKEGGLYEDYKDKLIFIDPYSVEDIRNKIEFLLDEKNYADYFYKIKSIDTRRSWEDVAKEHTSIFMKVSKADKGLVDKISRADKRL